MFTSQAHCFLILFTMFIICGRCAEGSALGLCDYLRYHVPSCCYCTSILDFLQDNDELITTIEVLDGQEPENLLYGSNVTVMCKTKLASSSMWWTFKEHNVSEFNGYVCLGLYKP